MPADPVDVSESAGPSMKSKGKHCATSPEDRELSGNNAMVSHTLGDGSDEEEEIIDVS